MFRKSGLFTLMLPLALATACSDDEGGGGDVDAAPDVDATESRSATFAVTIENLSGTSMLPTPFAPGVWAVHAPGDTLFVAGSADTGDGLEALAEDGAPGALLASLEASGLMAGVFDTPVGASAPGPLLPGASYEFEFTTEDTSALLSLASMFVQSNDVFVANGATEIPLFDDAGEPLAERDITAMLSFWDAGTEADQAPGAGPDQAPRQSAADSGAAEGVVRPFTDSTRALPAASKLVNIEVTEDGGQLTLTLTNTSADSGALVTPIAPLFYATHDDTWSLFSEGTEQRAAGLETLAEDGSPADLVGSLTGAGAIDVLGAQPRTLENPGMDGPAMPGQRYQIQFTPQADYPQLTIAAMVVQTNDAFLALPWAVSLFDSMGDLRPVADIQADIARALAVWDAGTEANQVPGVGPDQAPRQTAGNTGAPDPDGNVRRYADATNDLGMPSLGGFAEVTVTHGKGEDFIVRVTNTSDQSGYPGVVTPPLWGLSDGTAGIFQWGSPASAGLETMAEDGDPMPLRAETLALDAFSQAEVGAMEPLMAGESAMFTVSPKAGNPYLNLVAMVVPSNDTFLSLGDQGVRLLDENGQKRDEADIAMDIALALGAWDAGTEANQSGAGGRDQAPRQMGPNTGRSEGDGTIRPLEDPVWAYPAVADTVRVMIRPVP